MPRPPVGAAGHGLGCVAWAQKASPELRDSPAHVCLGQRVTAMETHAGPRLAGGRLLCEATLSKSQEAILRPCHPLCSAAPPQDTPLGLGALTPFAHIPEFL